MEDENENLEVKMVPTHGKGIWFQQVAQDPALNCKLNKELRKLEKWL